MLVPKITQNEDYKPVNTKGTYLMNTITKTISNPLLQARKDIRYLTSLVKGLVALDEYLGETAEIEKLLVSREELLVNKRAEAAALDAKLATAKTELASVETELTKKQGLLTEARSKFDKLFG
jgi:hypothetical protein